MADREWLLVCDPAMNAIEGSLWVLAGGPAHLRTIRFPANVVPRHLDQHGEPTSGPVGDAAAYELYRRPYRGRPSSEWRPSPGIFTWAEPSPPAPGWTTTPWRVVGERRPGRGEDGLVDLALLSQQGQREFDRLRDEIESAAKARRRESLAELRAWLLARGYRASF